MFLTVCVEGMHRSWIKLYPNLDWAFTSSSSFFSLEGVKQVKTILLTILNVREVTRGGRILDDFFPSSNCVTFLMAGGTFHRR